MTHRSLRRNIKSNTFQKCRGLKKLSNRSLPRYMPPYIWSRGLDNDHQHARRTTSTSTSSVLAHHNCISSTEEHAPATVVRLDTTRYAPRMVGSAWNAECTPSDGWPHRKIQEPLFLYSFLATSAGVETAVHLVHDVSSTTSSCASGRAQCAAHSEVVVPLQRSCILCASPTAFTRTMRPGHTFPRLEWRGPTRSWSIGMEKQNRKNCLVKTTIFLLLWSTSILFVRGRLW